MTTTIPTSQREGETHVSNALWSYARVEAVVCAGEAQFGRQRLLEASSAVSVQEHQGHVADYRGVIRTNWWPHVETGADTPTFLRGFHESSVAYAAVAMQLLWALDSTSEDDLTEAHRMALAAESLRGQYGKSSLDGLDVRLERLEEQLLAEVGGDEQVLIDLGSLTGALVPAESALLSDFVAMRRIFPSPPTIQTILDCAADDAHVAWRFLRRHHRWNVATLANTYEALADAESHALEAEERRTEVETRRVAHLGQLAPAALDLVDSVLALNFLNLVLEPAFGFKGGVGLVLGRIFRRVECEITGRSPMERQALLEKRHLLRVFGEGESSCMD